MQKSSIPAKYLLPWAQNDASKVEVPVTTTDPTRASLSLGFPPLTEQPPEVGGVPPQGEDFNGGMNQISRAIWWMMQGGSFPYDSAFASASQIGGYANSAAIPRADGAGFWLSTADNNLTNPDATDGTAANWVPLNVYGTASITVTSTDVTVYPVQAAFPVLLLSGTLTGNRNVILPAWTYQWKIIDNTVRGGFTLTVKTATGSGVVIATGSQDVRGDGTNIVQNPQSIAAATLGTQAARYDQLLALTAPAPNFFSELAVSATGRSATVTVSYAALVLSDGAGNYALDTNVSGGTINTASTGAGGLDTGTLAASTWYSVWRIAQPGGTKSWLISLSATAPTMPSGYTLKTRIGWIRTDGTANKYPLSFLQYGRSVQYQISVGSNVTAMPQFAGGTNGTFDLLTPTWAQINVTGVVPSTASQISVHLGATSASGNSMCVAPNGAYNGPQSTNPPPLTTVNIGNTVSTPVTGHMLLQFNYIFTAMGPNCLLLCAGWEDNL